MSIWEPKLFNYKDKFENITDINKCIKNLKMKKSQQKIHNTNCQKFSIRKQMF